MPLRLPIFPDGSLELQAASRDPWNPKTGCQATKHAVPHSTSFASTLESRECLRAARLTTACQMAQPDARHRAATSHEPVRSNSRRNPAPSQHNNNNTNPRRDTTRRSLLQTTKAHPVPPPVLCSPSGNHRLPAPPTAGFIEPALCITRAVPSNHHPRHHARRFPL